MVREDSMRRHLDGLAEVLIGKVKAIVKEEWGQVTSRLQEFIAKK